MLKLNSTVLKVKTVKIPGIIQKNKFNVFPLFVA